MPCTGRKICTDILFLLFNVPFPFLGVCFKINLFVFFNFLLFFKHFSNLQTMAYSPRLALSNQPTNNGVSL
jgi:hypothetical protein